MSRFANNLHHVPSTAALQQEIVELKRRLAESNRLLAEFQIKAQDVSRFQPIATDSAVVVIDREFDTILHASEPVTVLFELSVDDVVGRNAAEFLGPRAAREASILQIKDDGGFGVIETEIVSAAGERKPVLLTSRKIIYRGRRAVYSIITEFASVRETEKALRGSDVRYHQMYSMLKLMSDTVPDLIWAKDLEDRYLFANTAICEKLLMSRKGESPIGKTDIFFAERERREGYVHTFGEICVNSDAVVKKTKKPGRFLEEGLVRGRYLVLDVHKAPLFDDRGELIGTVGSGRDVTEDIATRQALEESERRFSLLANNVRDVLWISDTLFNPTYVTPSIETLAGYTPQEFLRIPIWFHMVGKYESKYWAMRRLVARALGEGRKIVDRTLEFACKRKDGNIIWVEILTSPKVDDDGTVSGFIGVIRDTTRRRQEQQELKSAKELALAASRTKSEFLANMSHEIRTPLNGVLGILQLLKETPLDATQTRYIETALASGQSLLTIISDILDFSKIESGKIELVSRPFSVRQLMEAAVEPFSCLIDDTRVSLTYDVEDEVADIIIGDEARLKQILYNIIGNAVKFTTEGAIRVHVSMSRRLEGTRAELAFCIIDTGIGISPEIVGRLFEPFVQEDGSYTRKFGGTGLGLSIVKKLVTMMGGQVAIVSEPGRGTEVECRVVVDIGEVLENPEKKLQSSLPLQAARILVVEDERINAMVISAMLTKFGHQVHIADNGLQALEMVDEGTFDCILMDIQMPKMDGVETTKRLRQKMAHKKRIPIVALTAHAMKGDRERFLDADMDDYLAKPVKLEELKGVLSRQKIGW